MFERFTEPARRVIFFARYETSQYGSPTIESEHLLLGLLREDRPLIQGFLSDSEGNEIRERVDKQVEVRQKISTSIDLPLSEECKNILKHSIAEAETLKHNFISTGHLLLGILSETSCGAARILNNLGIELGAAREKIGQNAPAANADDDLTRLVNRFSIPHTPLPAAGVVPDADTAKRIAQAVWNAQLPELSAVLMHGVWLVTGTQNGVLSAFIQKEDGKILRIHREEQRS